MKRVDTRLRDMCFEAAKQGFAFDVAWCDDLAGRNVEGCVIPDAAPVRAATPNMRVNSRGMLVADNTSGGRAVRPADKTDPLSPAPLAKDADMDEETAEKLLAFLSEKLEPDDLDLAKQIMAGEEPSDMATDTLSPSLQRRVRQSVARQRTATAPAFDKMFPNANRLG